MHIFYTITVNYRYRFQVIELELSTGRMIQHYIRNFIPFFPTLFEPTKDGLLMGGYFNGKVPVVIFYDFKTYKSKVLPALLNEPGELIQIFSANEQTFSIIISSRNPQRQKTLWIKNYTSNGDLLQNKNTYPFRKSRIAVRQNNFAQRWNPTDCGHIRQSKFRFFKRLVCCTSGR